MKHCVLITIYILSIVFVQFSFAMHRVYAATPEPVLVKDINPGSPDSYCYAPGELVDLNGQMYFCATDGVHGGELWRTDGTEAGTAMVKDIRPGSGSSNITYLVVFNNALYFGANNGTNGLELWRTDGTEAGTVMVKDIRPGSGNSNIAYLVVFNNALYFGANNGTNGFELWRSDGTAEGTVLVKDIFVGAGFGGPGGHTVLNGVLYFAATDGTNGRELWKSDGTAEGTVMVKDIYPGSADSAPDKLVVFGNHIYFAANDGINGSQIWRSNGTESGTNLFKITNSSGNAEFWSPAVLNTTLFFAASDATHGNELWKSDGTPEGTVMVKDIKPSEGSYPYNLIVANNKLYFVADGGSALGVYRYGLWISDGTDEGTVMLEGTWPGITEIGTGWIYNMENYLYFNAISDLYGEEVWKLEIDNTHPGSIKIGISKDNKKTPGEITLKVDDREVKLYFSAKDDFGVDKIRVSEHHDFRGASWEDYDGTKKVKLSSGDETKTIYFKFKDDSGNETKTYTQKFKLDTTPPELEITKVGTLNYQTEITMATDKTLYYSSPSVVMTGSAEDAEEIRFIVNDDTKTKLKLHQNNFEISYAFETGKHTVEIIAEDSVGQMTSEKFNLVIDPTGKSFPKTLTTYLN